MMKQAFVLVLLCISINIIGLAQTCNKIQQLNLNQEVKLKELFASLEEKLKLEDQDGIDSIHLLIKSELSIQQGLPADLEKYTELYNNSELLPLSSSITLSRKLIEKDKEVYQNLWKLAKGMKPKTTLPNSIFLRTSAEYAKGLLFIAEQETDNTRKLEYSLWATQALDSLLTMQLPNGAFPFPDLRQYNDPVFSSILNKFILSCGKDSLKVVSNGWIIDDKNTGEFKFDAGVISNAYYHAFLLTKNIKYKEAVIKLANYLQALPINLNYNYNTFVILGLTNAYAMTGNTSYLLRALENLKLGVIEGQADNGKWIDGHNASARYHSIIIQNCTELLPYLESKDQEKLNSMLLKAVRNQISSTLNCGASTGFRWLLNKTLYDQNAANKSLIDSTLFILGKYIQSANNNGNFIDIPSMGEYLNFLTKTMSIENKTFVEINIQPNPANNYFQIVSEEQFESISILDMNGSTMKHIQITNNHPIDIKEIPNGIYEVIFTSNNEYYSRKIVVAR